MDLLVILDNFVLLMIRVPFSSHSKTRTVTEPARPSLREDGVPASEEERVAWLEARLSTLEVKLVKHAEELKWQVSERVVRIQSRLENAMRPFAEEELSDEGESAGEGGAAANVVPFVGASKNLHHLHASNAREALHELNQTLRLTREHLEALASSVDRMRRSVDKAG